jgi:hypothetical protein
MTVNTCAMPSRTTLLLVRRARGDWRQCPLHAGKKLRAAAPSTHILDSLLGAPPVTLATRSAASSCFRSFSCVAQEGVGEQEGRGSRGEQP